MSIFLGHEGGAYVVKGKLLINEKHIKQYAIAVRKNSGVFYCTHLKIQRLCYLGGKPIGQRYIYCNFVPAHMKKLKKQNWIGRMGWVRQVVDFQKWFTMIVNSFLFLMKHQQKTTKAPLCRNKEIILGNSNEWIHCRKKIRKIRG